MGHSYTDLIAWQKAVELVTDIYRETRKFPKDEMYGLTNQMRRAAVSVPSNVAEGQGRLSSGEFRHFLGTARASLLELQTQITIAVNLEYLPPETGRRLFVQSTEVLKILNALIKSLATRGPNTRNSQLETRN